MSKYLIKILSICAFVILIPLIIVGSALCVTEAMACTLKVLDGGVEGGYGTSSNVTIFIDNEKQDTNEISVKKNTEVTVTYEGTGYDFVGWYNGNYEEIDREKDQAVNTSVSYTFFVRGNTTLTAVRDVKEYTITYAGVMDDGSDVVIEEGEQGKTYKYGEALKTLEPVAGATFDGWYVVNSTDVSSYKTATFANSGEYTLNPAWSNQMVISYQDKDTGYVIAQDRVTEQSLRNYQLVDSEDSRVVDYLTNKKPGYDFVSWVDINGDDVKANEIPFTVNTEYVMYISLSERSYNITVQRSEIDETTANVTYKVSSGFSSYNTEREGYNFVGVNYNDTLYTYNSETNDYVNNGISLGTVLVNENALNVNVVAVWECVYPDFALYINGVSNYEIEGIGQGNWEVFGKNGDEYTIISDIQKAVMFEDKVGENYYNTDSDVLDLAFGGFEGIYRQTGIGTGEYKEVTLKTPLETVEIRINDIAKPIPLGMATGGTITFNDIFNAIQSEIDSGDLTLDISTISKISLTFNFVLA